MTSRKSKPAIPGGPPVPEGRYEPTPREAAALAAHRNLRESRPPRPKMKCEKGYVLSFDHADQATAWELLTIAAGFTSAYAVENVLNHLAQFCGRDERALERQLNGMLATITGIGPRDDVEAMLASQMAVTHELSLVMARRLAKAENIPQQDSAERAFNKLGRTFAAQIEALRRHRHGGQQKVTVEHVTVNDGGQAIVGNVGAGGDGRKS